MHIHVVFTRIDISIYIHIYPYLEHLLGHRLGLLVGRVELEDLLIGAQSLKGNKKQSWPLHNIAITNIVCCIAYKRGVGGGARLAQ